MRIAWIGIAAVVGFLALPRGARAQVTEAADAGDIQVDVGLRIGGFTGLTRTGRHPVYGYPEPHWGEAELVPGGSIGGVVTVELGAWPIAFRASADWTLDAALRIHLFGCGAGPETHCGPVDRDAASSRAFADLLWYAAPRGSRWRPFLAGGVGLTRFESSASAEPLVICLDATGCATDPFAGERIDPAVHGAAGVDLGLGRVRLSAAAGVYATLFDSADDRSASGWNRAAVLSLGARFRVR